MYTWQLKSPAKIWHQHFCSVVEWPLRWTLQTETFSLALYVGNKLNELAAVYDFGVKLYQMGEKFVAAWHFCAS